MTQISALVPYFGGKRSLAPRIVEEICRAGRPDFFAEPFCGSMAVSLAMPEIPTHIVSDKNADIVLLATVLADEQDGYQLIDRLGQTTCSEMEYQRASTILERYRSADAENRYNNRTEIAWAVFVAGWLGPNGSAQDDDGRFCVRWGPGGGDPATRLRSAVDAAASIRERVRRFTILNRDGFEVIGKAVDHPKTALYVDPPYLRDTRGAGSYTHDFEDHGGGIFALEGDDHDRLAVALNRFKQARIVVSYYDAPRLHELYPAPRWRFVDLGEAEGMMNAAGSTQRERREVLIVNDGEGA